MSSWEDTRDRLRNWTGGSSRAEFLAAQVLHEEGYKKIDPSHPLGGPDGAADALVLRNDDRWVMAVYFTNEPRGFNELKSKLISDFRGVALNGAVGLAFVTNARVSRAERAKLDKAVDGPLDLFHLERLAMILERPAMANVRSNYLRLTSASPLRPLTRPEAPDQLFNVPVAIGGALVSTDEIAYRLDSRRRIALTGSSGAGKTHCAELVASSMPTETAVVVVRLDNWSPELSKRLELAPRGQPALPALDIVLECADSDITAAQLEQVAQREKTLLVVDGVNEVSDQAIAQLVVDSIDEAARVWPDLLVLATDRGSERYGNRWTVAEVHQLESLEAASRVNSAHGPGTWEALSEGARTLLRTPFFLARALLSESPTNASGAAALRDYFLNQARIPVETLDLLANLTLDAYCHGVRTILRSALPVEAARLLADANVLRNADGSESPLQFAHQLYGDYLVSRALGKVREWGPELLDAATFDLQASEPVVFAIEALAATDGDRYLMAVYNWNWVLAVQAVTAPGAVQGVHFTQAAYAALMALLSERRGDPLEGTSLRATELLRSAEGDLAAALQSAPPHEARAVVEPLGFDVPWFNSWKEIFCRPDDASPSELDAARIASSNAFEGWTAANALRRALISPTVARDLRAVYRGAAGKDDHARAIRWRVVHTLGKSPDQETLRFLLDAISNDPDVRVRFGATRSVVEHAAITEDSLLSEAAFAGLAERLSQQSDRVGAVAAWSAMYRGASDGFREAAQHLFEGLRDAQTLDAARERWDERLQALRSYWQGVKVEAFGMADPYGPRQANPPAAATGDG